MATTTTISSNYAGEAGAILRQSFEELDAVNKGVVTLYPNVRYKLNLRKVSTVDGKTAYTCGHSPSGSITLSEKVITLKDVKDDFAICKNDFRQTWDGLDGEMLDAIAADRLEQIIEEMGAEIWSGDDSAAQFNGLITQFGADGSVIKANNGITATGAAVTKANVLAQFEKVSAAIPNAIRMKADLKFVVSANVAEFYSQYLVSNGIGAGFGGGEFALQYGRYEVIVDAGLPDDTFVVARQSNLVFAMDSQAALNEVSLVDEDAFGRLTGNVIGKIAYSANVGYYNSEEIVWFLSTTV